MPAINFKGGTGKTTVAIAIVEGLCHLLGKRVLIIDCDFQCSASITLLGRKTLNDLISRDATLDCQLQREMSGGGAPLSGAAIPARHCVEEALEVLAGGWVAAAHQQSADVDERLQGELGGCDVVRSCGREQAGLPLAQVPGLLRCPAVAQDERGEIKRFGGAGERVVPGGDAALRARRESSVGFWTSLI